MTTQDTELAVALWARSKEFSQKKEYYHALLDISATYRLLTFSEDPRVPQAHQEWILAYQKYQDAGAATAGLETKTVERLERLLKQIDDRRY